MLQQVAGSPEDAGLGADFTLGSSSPGGINSTAARLNAANNASVPQSIQDEMSGIVEEVIAGQPEVSNPAGRGTPTGVPDVPAPAPAQAEEQAEPPEGRAPHPEAEASRSEGDSPASQPTADDHSELDPELEAALEKVGLGSKSIKATETQAPKTASPQPLVWDEEDELGRKARELYEATTADNRHDTVKQFTRIAQQEGYIKQLQDKVGELLDLYDEQSRRPFDEDASMQRHFQAVRDENGELGEAEAKSEARRRMAVEKLDYEKSAQAVQDRLQGDLDKFRSKRQENTEREQQAAQRKLAGLLEHAKSDLHAEYMAQLLAKKEFQGRPASEIQAAAEVVAARRVAEALPKLDDSTGVLGNAIVQMLVKRPEVLRAAYIAWHNQTQRKAPQQVAAEGQARRARVATPEDQGPIQSQEDADAFVDDLVEAKVPGLSRMSARRAD